MASFVVLTPKDFFALSEQRQGQYLTDLLLEIGSVSDPVTKSQLIALNECLLAGPPEPEYAETEEDWVEVRESNPICQGCSKRPLCTLAVRDACACITFPNCIENCAQRLNCVRYTNYRLPLKTPGLISHG